MAIHYTLAIEDDILVVHASGFDESLEQVEQYGLAIIQAAVQNQVTHVLCNETDLVYQLDTMDTYQAAEFIALNAPHVARVAIICNPKFILDVQFWENVVVNRGLTARFFKDADSALLWLKGQTLTE